MLDDFKKFAIKGNVLDMAIGVMIGGAFGKIVSSLVSDIITPIISIVTNKVDLTNLFITIGTNKKFDTLAQAKEAGVTTLNYGAFLQNVIDFLIISLVIYFFVKQMERLKNRLIPVLPIKSENKDQPEEKAETEKECMYCFSKIDIRARRCPHCTAVLEETDQEYEDADKNEEKN